MLWRVRPANERRSARRWLQTQGLFNIMRVQFEVRRLPSYLASIPPALSALLASVSPSALDHSIRFHSTRQEFLKSNHRRLDKETMYRLLSAHGRVDFLLMYAALLEDYEKVKSRAA